MRYFLGPLNWFPVAADLVVGLSLKMDEGLRPEGPYPLLDSVDRPLGQTYSCYGSRQTLTSPSDSVLCLMRIAHAKFPSDTTRCPMVTSESVCPTTMPIIVDRGFKSLVLDGFD